MRAPLAASLSPHLPSHHAPYPPTACVRVLRLVVLHCWWTHPGIGGTGCERTRTELRVPGPWQDPTPSAPNPGGCGVSTHWKPARPPACRLAYFVGRPIDNRTFHSTTLVALFCTRMSTLVWTWTRALRLLGPTVLVRPYNDASTQHAHDWFSLVCDNVSYMCEQARPQC